MWLSNNDLESKLKPWLKRTFSGAEYASAILEFNKHDEVTYSNKKVKSREEGLSLQIWCQGVKNNRVYFSSGYEDAFDRLDLLLRNARENVMETTIHIPQDKKIACPAEDYTTEIYLDYGWEIDTDIIRDLKRASGATKRFKTETSTELDLKSYFFIDTNNVILAYSSNSFVVKALLDMGSEKELRRVNGFNPKSEGELAKIYSLLPYTVDVTLDNSLQSSETFEGLMKAMAKQARIINKHSISIDPGLYEVVMPMTSFPHECIGHCFEQDLLRRRNTIGGSNLTAKPLFRTKLKVGPSSLTFRDNPRKKLNGLKVVGTRAYDLEGIRTGSKTHIKNGWVEGNFLGSRYSERSNTGNAIASEEYSMPMPRMSVSETNPASGGPKNLQEMLECNDGRKTLVCNKGTGYCSLETGQFTLGGTSQEYESNPEIFLYAYGELTPIKTYTLISGDVYNALKGVKIGGRSTISYEPSGCGKYNPVTDTNDEIDTSQVGPLAMMPLYATTLRKLNNSSMF